MAKPEMEFCDSLPMGQWRKVEGAGEGISEKILSWDPDTGNLTRLVKFSAGASVPNTQVHDFCEEVFVLEGYMLDTAKKITAAPGYYACRPEGMIHGPYEVPVSCLCYEVRYQDPAKPLNPDCSLYRMKP